MTKIRERYIPPPLKVDDEVWLLRGVLLYEATVREVNTLLAGEPHEFQMYKLDIPHSKYLSSDSQHRNDIFLRTVERKQLIEEINSRIESLEYLKKDLEEEPVESKLCKHGNPDTTILGFINCSQCLGELGNQLEEMIKPKET